MSTGHTDLSYKTSHQSKCGSGHHLPWNQLWILFKSRFTSPTPGPTVRPCSRSCFTGKETLCCPSIPPKSFLFIWVHSISSWYAGHLCRLFAGPALSRSRTPDLPSQPAWHCVISAHAHHWSWPFSGKYWQMGSVILIFSEASLLSGGGLQSPQLSVLLDVNNFLTPKGPWVYPKHRK